MTTKMTTICPENWLFGVFVLSAYLNNCKVTKSVLF